MARVTLGKTMAGAGVKIETIEFLQFLDPLQVGGIERALSIEGMQNNAFQKIAERQVVIVGKGSQNFQEPLLHAHARLDALNVVCQQCVPWYLSTRVTQAAGLVIRRILRTGGAVCVIKRGATKNYLCGIQRPRH